MVKCKGYILVRKNQNMSLAIIMKFLMFVTICEGMTMKQIQNMGKLMRKSCQPKNNVEEEKLNAINDGVFNEERDVKCYIACVMKMANTHKNGKVSYEAAMKQADIVLPEYLKVPAKEALTACKKSADGQKDICDASFLMTKCIYDNNPEIFYFP